VSFTLTGTIEGAAQLAGKFAAMEAKTLVAVGVGMERAVLGGQSVVRGKARGRPGPRAVTGDYNRSIVGESQIEGTHARGMIGTNAAQGRRLEFGFVGPDALGRVYNQPPFPHFGPSVPEISTLAVEALGGAIKAALG
jgi:hypothetical protein